MLSDNYSYIVWEEEEEEESECETAAFVVDASDPELVLSRAGELGVRVEVALTTHRHWDHSAGNAVLRHRLGRVFGGRGDDVPDVTDEVGQGDSVRVGNLAVSVLGTPCHTKGHVMYLVENPAGEKALFTGDMLFVAGCGRFNEGTGEQMHNALNGIVAQLPGSTKIYCGHEYTYINLKFAAQVEPGNKDITKMLEFSRQMKSLGRPTVPSTVELEKKINPFMRVHIEEVKAFTGKQYENLHLSIS